jgi:hypothetical protein
MSNRVKKFKRDLCKLVGHNFGEVDHNGWTEIDKRCRRCNATYSSTVMQDGQVGMMWGVAFYESK